VPYLDHYKKTAAKDIAMEGFRYMLSDPFDMREAADTKEGVKPVLPLYPSYLLSRDIANNWPEQGTHKQHAHTGRPPAQQNIQFSTPFRHLLLFNGGHGGGGRVDVMVFTDAI
jgi:hypothetical protein